jgi:Cu+-exporting ATPase
MSTKQDQYQDPVCSMVVSNDSEFHVHHEDKDYYFCSEHCLQKFKEHPEKYLGQQTLVPHEAHGDQSPIPAPCILKFNNRDREIVRNVGWRWRR